MIFRFLSISRRSLTLLWYALRHRHTEEFHPVFAIKIRETLESLGPTFIKLGQILSMRPDYVPRAYCNELEKLLDNTPPISSEIIRKCIEAELGKPLRNVFQSFDSAPVASASLSQVHKAVLWDDSVVAVKVLRPGVRKIIHADVQLMKLGVFLFGNRIGKMKKRYWYALIKQLKKWLMEETDYENELENINTVWESRIPDSDVYTPKVYPEWSTKRVLVMEFIEGWTVNELMILHREGKMPELNFDITERITYFSDFCSHMSLGKGRIHGDLHPANVILTEEGKIYVIDIGLLDYLDVHMRNYVTLFVCGAIFASPELTMKAIYKLGKTPKNFDEQEFFGHISKMCDRFYNAKTTEMSSGQFLVESIDLFLQHGFEIPWSVVMFARTSLVFDSMILAFCPDYVFSEHKRPVLMNIYAKNLLKEHCTIPKAISIVDDVTSMIMDAPETLHTFIDAFSEQFKAYESI